MIWYYIILYYILSIAIYLAFHNHKQLQQFSKHWCFLGSTTTTYTYITFTKTAAAITSTVTLGLTTATNLHAYLSTDCKPASQLELTTNATLGLSVAARASQIEPEHYTRIAPLPLDPATQTNFLQTSLLILFPPPPLPPPPPTISIYKHTRLPISGPPR